MKSLAEGNHKLKVTFTDGTAETTFTVEKEKTSSNTTPIVDDEKDNTPKTGNTSVFVTSNETIIYATILIISTALIMITKSKVRK